MAALAAIISGVIGALVWLADVHDRGDGDKLRWGFWHNPFMQFPPFNEAFLDLSMLILLICSAAAGVGGLLILLRLRLGVAFVTWPARVSIVINSVVAVFIVATMFAFADFQRGEWHLGGTSIALLLRLGSIALDLILWIFLSTNAVNEFLRWHAHPPDRSFDVITRSNSPAIQHRIHRKVIARQPPLSLGAVDLG